MNSLALACFVLAGACIIFGAFLIAPAVGVIVSGLGFGVAGVANIYIEGE